jgi:hypothetical protein
MEMQDMRRWRLSKGIYGGGRKEVCDDAQLEVLWKGSEVKLGIFIGNSVIPELNVASGTAPNRV